MMEKSGEEFFCYSLCWARGNSCWECLCAQLELPLCSVWLQGICGCWDLWAPRARLFGSSPLVANMKVGVQGMWISFFHGEAGEQLVFYFWGEPWGGSRGHAYLGFRQHLVNYAVKILSGKIERWAFLLFPSVLSLGLGEKHLCTYLKTLFV